MYRTELRESADIIEKILGKVHDGTLDASGPVANAVVRRLEGAQITLQAAVNPRRKLSVKPKKLK